MYTIRTFLRRNLKCRCYSQYQHPATRTVQALTRDIKNLVNKEPNSIIYPEHTDVVIIGAGSIGVSIAYWLKSRTGRGLDVVVLDNNTKNESANCSSFGGLHHHYSLPENILLSQYTADFLRKGNEHLYPDFDVKYAPHGYLLLASEEYGADLNKTAIIQREFGVKNILLTPDKIKQTYPWINTDGIALGCITTECEGWFDSTILKEVMKLKSRERGAEYYEAEVTGFKLENQRDVLMEGVAPGTYQKLSRVIYKAKDEQEYELKFAYCVLAAGVSSGELAKKAGIGVLDGMLSLPLPVVPRKCNLYSFECNKLNLDTPLVMDTSGTWLRRDGLANTFICGQAPISTLSWRGDEVVDNKCMKDAVQKSLVHRFPVLEDINITNTWTENYDYTYYDETGIIGPHPYYNNLFFATGFGNQGIQHAPGIGMALTELIIDSNYSTIDLTRFGFDRFLTGDSVIENKVF